jgi:hypothetical protein
VYYARFNLQHDFRRIYTHDLFYVWRPACVAAAKVGVVRGARDRVK